MESFITENTNKTCEEKTKLIYFLVFIFCTNINTWHSLLQKVSLTNSFLQFSLFCGWLYLDWYSLWRKCSVFPPESHVAGVCTLVSDPRLEFSVVQLRRQGSGVWNLQSWKGRSIQEIHWSRWLWGPVHAPGWASLAIYHVCCQVRSTAYSGGNALWSILVSRTEVSLATFSGKDTPWTKQVSHFPSQLISTMLLCEKSLANQTTVLTATMTTIRTERNTCNFSLYSIGIVG